MAYRLDSSASITVSYVLCNSSAHFWPPVISGYKFIGRCMSRVSGCRVVMAVF